MEAHFELSDAEFEKQFRNCKLSPSIFSHEAHLRLAWLHLDKYGLEQAIANIQDQLQAFVAQLGATDKYNKTLSIAAVQIVHHFKDQSTSNNFKDFILEFPQLKNNFKGLLDSHFLEKCPKGTKQIAH